jgi:hypothetical protein
MARPKKTVRRIDGKSLYYRGDGKGFLVMFLSLILVLISVFAVMAINKVENEESEVVDILLAQPEVVDTGCNEFPQNVEINRQIERDCFAEATIACTDGTTKVFNRLSTKCLSQGEWRRFSKAFCNTQRLNCEVQTGETE